jgi:hypothetical protein
MGYSELSLPTDIPWKRLAVSADMLDEGYGDLQFPRKWDSSIAAFYHEPVESDPAYCNRRITYLKIVCTITNYQLAGQDVTVLGWLRDRGFSGWPFKEFDLNATRAYPCHGALLQVGVHPNPGDGVELHDYPYVASMQPRKRELYEVATQSGEVASQSANKLNVTKGGTSTNTQEDYDLDLGGGSGGHSGLFGLWSEQHSGEQKQVGTIQRSQTQNQNVATTDASRDRRESFSFSTSINQLHTLLQSYHLGTNRVMFFMQPVPHMQDTKFSFVRGLRRIEGVQEFFLVINRPAHVKGFCLEIALETAHLYVRRAYMPRLIPLADLYTPGNLAKTEKAIGSAVQGNAFFDAYRSFRDAWNLQWPTDRWRMAQPGWYPGDDTQALAAQVLAQATDIGTQDAALIFEEYEAHTGQFFVTGRRFCACWLPAPHEPPADGMEAGEDELCEESSPASLSTCDAFPGAVVFSDRLDAAAFTQAALGSAQYYNQLAGALNHALSSSLLARERQAYGRGSFFATDFMLDELRRLVRGVDAAVTETRLEEFEAVRRHRATIPAATMGSTLGEFLRQPVARVAHAWQIDSTAARRLQLDVLLEAAARVDPQRLPPPEGDDANEDPAARDLRLAASARGVARPRPRGEGPSNSRPEPPARA